MVIIRDDLLSRSPEGLPAMLDYNVQSKAGSAHNTPPVFAIYLLGLVVKWLQRQGGLVERALRNEEKAKPLYTAIDSSEFYRGHALSDHRSLTNVTFRLPSEDLEQQFVRDAEESGLMELKGHRSVGGIRASIYNAFPKDGVEALVSFMGEFERTRG